MDSAVDRRQLLVGAATAPLAGRALAQTGRGTVIVVGAGVFGAWTARALQDAGRQVLLVEGVDPAHNRASSGGESRMIRAGYGNAEIYSRMAMESLPDWKALSRTAGLPIFHETGVLFFAAKENSYTTRSLEVTQKLGLKTFRLEQADLRKRWPQVDWSDIGFGIFEPAFGALMARRSIQTLVDGFVRNGGEYRRAAVKPPAPGRIERIVTESGDVLSADSYVFACGPWLPKLFPALLADRLFVTRQTVCFIGSPAGDGRFAPAALPGWADYNDGDLYYGFPDLEGRGLKLARDTHGPIVDPDRNVRTPTPEELALLTNYVARRFPALASQPVTEVRVCQYENSTNGDFLIDRHPDSPNTVLVGTGSGHGFKHGPAVGRLAAKLVLGTGAVEPRFALSTKQTHQARSVI